MDTSQHPPNAYQEDSGAEEVIDGRTSHKIKGEKKKIEAIDVPNSHWLMKKEGLEETPFNKRTLLRPWDHLGTSGP